MLGSSLGETERPGVLGAQEKIGRGRASLEQLSPSEDPKPGSLPCQGGTEQQEEETEEEKGEINTDDILMEDDQVADFASSKLAAISCWHYRARALLSALFTTVRLTATNGFPISSAISLAFQSTISLSV